MVLMLTEIKKIWEIIFKYFIVTFGSIISLNLKCFNVFLNKSDNKSMETLCAGPNFLISYKDIYQAFKQKKV